MKAIQVKVKPHARTTQLLAQNDGSWLAQLAAAPIDGQANAALITLVARHFGVSRSQVRIQSGAASRIKRLQIDD